MTIDVEVAPINASKAESGNLRRRKSSLQGRNLVIEVSLLLLEGVWGEQRLVVIQFLCDVIWPFFFDFCLEKKETQSSNLLLLFNLKFFFAFCFLFFVFVFFLTEFWDCQYSSAEKCSWFQEPKPFFLFYFIFFLTKTKNLQFCDIFLLIFIFQQKNREVCFRQIKFWRLL